MVGGTTVTYTTGAGEFLISKARLFDSNSLDPSNSIIILIYSTCIVTAARDHGLLAVRDTYDTAISHSCHMASHQIRHKIISKDLV